jgi:hypothetical protein
MKINNIADSIIFIIDSIGLVFFGKKNKEILTTTIRPRNRITANEALRSDWKKLSIDANIAVNKVKQKYKI